MKSLKYLILPLLFFSIINNTFATGGGTSGYGCNLGNVIYSQKIGTTKFYGTNYDVYKSNGTSYPIDWNNASTPNQINSNNVVSQNETCWVNSYVNPKNDNNNVSYGTLVYFTVNPNPTDVPLDDYVWFIILLIGGFGCFAIYKKHLLTSQL